MKTGTSSMFAGAAAYVACAFILAVGESRTAAAQNSPCSDVHFGGFPNAVWDGRDPRPGPRGTVVCTEVARGVRGLPSAECDGFSISGLQNDHHVTIQHIGTLDPTGEFLPGYVEILGETGELNWYRDDDPDSDFITVRYGLNWDWAPPAFSIRGAFSVSGSDFHAVGNVDFVGFFDPWDFEAGQWEGAPNFLALFNASRAYVCEALSS